MPKLNRSVLNKEPFFVAIEARKDNKLPYFLLRRPSELSPSGRKTGWKPRIGVPVPWGLDPRCADNDNKPQYRLLVRRIYQPGSVEYAYYILYCLFRDIRDMGMSTLNADSVEGMHRLDSSLAEALSEHFAEVAERRQLRPQQVAKLQQARKPLQARKP